MLVTQNIDDYHEQLVRESPILNKTKPINIAFNPYVNAIHGNVFYMHCSDEDEEHSREFHKSPALDLIQDRKNHVPLCSVCGKTMKPHCMFFDECYSEHYYRMKTVDRFLEDCDALIVIGTALATSFAKRIVQDCVSKEDVPVIEVNLETFCDRGYVAQLLMKSEIVLPILF